MIEKRYLAEHVGFANSRPRFRRPSRKKFRDLAGFFQKYSDRVCKLDYLLMAAQGYQESGLDQSVKSKVGAVGVHAGHAGHRPAQLQVGDITKTEANIHAGVKYMRFMVDQYFKDEPMDSLNKGLFAFASYNAGPARIRHCARRRRSGGSTPTSWFGNVEPRSPPRRIGDGRRSNYVANIYKYYIAYKLVAGRNVRGGTRR